MDKPEIKNIPAADAEGMIKLWHDVFGDSEEFVAEYLTRFARPGNYLLERDHATGEVIGMVHFPTLTDAVTGSQYAYLYALAVDSRYRCRGIADRLVKELFATTNCTRVATIPASDTLQLWYASRFGFRHPEFPPVLFRGIDFDLGTGNPETDLFMVKQL